MRIPDSVIAAQMMRLSRLANWSADPAMHEELATAMRSACDDPEHLAQVVDAWVRKSKWAPFPSDIYETAEANPRRVTITAGRDRSCVCGGTGWEPVWQLITHTRHGEARYRSIDLIVSPEDAARLKATVDGKDQMVYSAVRRCTHCAYGAELALKDNAA